MLAVLRSLRWARLLAVLAVILMAGLGQDAHACNVADQSGSVPAADAPMPGEEGGKAAPCDAYCAACHLARATMPDAAGVREPAVLRIDLVLPGEDLQPDLAVPDGPTRQPRHTRAV